MMKKHVTKELSAYCHGELGTEDARRVAEHVLTCQRCRKEFEEIKLGVALVGRLPRRSAPASMWEEIERARPPGSAAAWERTVDGSSPRRSFRPLPFALAATLLLALGIVAWHVMQSPRTSWEVIPLAGAPRVGPDHIGQTGSLAVGDWLETDGSSRAQINVGQIGHVEVEPNSRVRLLEARLTEHRLALERGAMRARIWAPPRLFFVETPSAVAVDLGCAYTLRVDVSGGGRLHVTSGWVSFELKGRVSIVPAGAVCDTRPGIGPGTPYFEDASQTLRDGLARINFEQGGAEALGVVLAESRPRDTLTLWHLLWRLGQAERSQTYDRLTALVAPPEGVTRDGVLRLDERMLDLWWEKLEPIWLSDAVPVWRRAWESLKSKKR